ncbi:DUF6734 family protein [Sorangium sp. So ce131]|uniref:DUF6734 family protein n=1 Tax=Sorangium sp. So ce131 TaxID=3133282 RepID=UPI003F600821
MRAVWSFWSKPFLAHYHRSWASPRHHLLSWVLSVRTAMRHYRPTALYTDDAGARMLVDGAGLEFDEVHTTLNAIAEVDPEWWALGKLYAYRAQSQPFVHIDSDVFLWQPLPSRLDAADLIAQNPEPFVVGRSYYQPGVFERALGRTAGAWLPEEWRWFRESGLPQRAECCGVFGGRHVSFVQHYAERAIHLIERAENQPAWATLTDKISHNILFEQYLLSACIEYHRAHEASGYRGVAIDYVFPSMAAAFNADVAARAGYTHLIADAKRNPELARRLEVRVARDHPAHFERCQRAAPVQPGARRKGFA